MQLCCKTENSCRYQEESRFDSIHLISLCSVYWIPSTALARGHKVGGQQTDMKPASNPKCRPQGQTPSKVPEKRPCLPLVVLSIPLHTQALPCPHTALHPAHLCAQVSTTFSYKDTTHWICHTH